MSTCGVLFMNALIAGVIVIGRRLRKFINAKIFSTTLFKVKKSCSTLTRMSELHFERIAPIYNVMNDIISLGMHRRWKKSMVADLLKRAPAAKRCLDVSTGTGDIALLMAKQ